jgi:hypothetical protein
MNTNQLKRFAQSARIKLIDQIGAKLEKVLTTDSVELREKAGHLKKLQEAINKTSKSEVIDTVAYTWFNRFVALRFMDVNSYEPIGVSVVSPMEGGTLPTILQEAKQGNIPEELPVLQQHIYDLLDGKIPSTDAQNEAYAALLVGACNHLTKTLPFLFEKIDDYAELLLPDDLISQFSILQDVRDGMTAEDCTEVEIIGWLYQFYISEKKDQVFASKGKVKKEDIPAATQLFTPRWIVEYMVQNTVGKLWLQNNPQSKLRDHMPYFIESPSVTADDYLKIDSVEDITLLDQACGSGHILVYGFELLSKIYEEEGYNKSDIPTHIIEKNLFGFEIDTRAAQLAGLALMLKARHYYRRVFKKEITPNISCYQDLKLKVYNYNDCKETFRVKKGSALPKDILNYGYCIAENIQEVWEEDHTDKKTGQTVTIERQQLKIKKGEQVKAEDLTNIKHFGNPEILFYIDEIKDTFRLANLELNHFLYLDLRHLLQATNLGSLILPKATANDITETLQAVNKSLNTADVFLKHNLNQIKTALEQLVLLSKKYHCVVDNPPYMGGGNMNDNLTYFVKTNYSESKGDLMTCFMSAANKILLKNGYFSMINFASWMFLSSFEKFRKHLLSNAQIVSLNHNGRGVFGSDFGTVCFVMKNNTKKNSIGVYRRLFKKQVQVRTNEKIKDLYLNKSIGYYEFNQNDFLSIPGYQIAYWINDKVLNIFKKDNFVSDVLVSGGRFKTCNDKRYVQELWEVNSYDLGVTWKFYENGGDARKWYGNLTQIFEWTDDSVNFYKKKGGLTNEKCWSKVGIVWNMITYNVSFRLKNESAEYSSGCPVVFLKEEVEGGYFNYLGYLNSKLVKEFLKILNPTLNTSVGVVLNIPILNIKNGIISELSKGCIEISKNEWNSRETSWDFKQNELIRIQGQDTSATINKGLEEAYDNYCQYWQNKFFELHKNEEELNRQFIDIYGLQEELTPEVPLEDITILKEETTIKKGALVFRESEIIAQFISYAVGCMFGRYSLDKPGLILANQGESLEDYVKNVYDAEKPPSGVWGIDDDNVIPVLDNEWFEDDIVNRFYAFLKATFGKPNFDKNLAFLEDAVGDIRKYFLKTFYTDHVKRYKKRPIYWLFSSPSGAFNALIYMHRYTPDTLNTMLNGYLKEYQEKLKAQDTQLAHVKNIGTDREKINAEKKQARISKVLIELQEYDRELFKIATERIAIDLDDGVLVNYNKFGNVIKQVSGLNDKKTKKKVREFDWIDVTEIQ